ncbi:MAG: hypothetical protein LBG47_06625 [Prevotellaceae bacterium]|jgi:hypothetical protein|nr:hypothetical protein [Prevotellaceae bacterium]
MKRSIKKGAYSIAIILLMAASPFSTSASLKVTVKKNKKGFYCVQKTKMHFDESTGEFIVDSKYYAPLPYKIVKKDTIYDITEYRVPGTGTYFFLPDGTPVGLNDWKITYTESEAFKAAEKNAALEDELEMMRRQLQDTERARKKEEERRKKAEKRRVL